MSPSAEERRPAREAERRTEDSWAAVDTSSVAEERYLCAAALQDSAITGTVVLSGDIFHDGRLGAVWDAVAAGESTPTGITAWAAAHGTRVDPDYVVGLVGESSVGEPDAWAEVVRDRHARTTLQNSITRLRQMLLNGTPTDAVRDEAEALLTGSQESVSRTRGVVERLDWAALFADDTEQEFIAYPLIPERRHVAVFSEAKVGKSLLMLEIAVAACNGTPVLGSETRRTRVLYVDFENDPRGDIRERLEDMGYGPEDLQGLVYLSFPSMAALNTPQGGAQLLANVQHYDCGLVVIDTVSRAIDGEENSNDTWLGLYAHTGLKLKQAGVSMVRLDHSGKDANKGQRGGSAKTGDVDAVWQLSRIDDSTFKLECSHHRFRLSPDDAVLTLHRREDPLRHDVDTGGAAVTDAKTAAVLADLDRLDVPADWGRDRVRERFKKAGRKHGNAAITAALKARKTCPGQVDQSPNWSTCPDSSGQVDGSTPENLSGTGPGQVGTGHTGGPVPALRSMERDRSDAAPKPPCSGKPQTCTNTNCRTFGTCVLTDQQKDLS